jgi:hypothetical protein
MIANLAAQGAARRKVVADGSVVVESAETQSFGKVA